MEEYSQRNIGCFRIILKVIRNDSGVMSSVKRLEEKLRNILNTMRSIQIFKKYFFWVTNWLWLCLSDVFLLISMIKCLQEIYRLCESEFVEF